MRRFVKAVKLFDLCNAGRVHALSPSVARA